MNPTSLFKYIRIILLLTFFYFFAGCEGENVTRYCNRPAIETLKEDIIERYSRNTSVLTQVVTFNSCEYKGDTEDYENLVIFNVDKVFQTYTSKHQIIVHVSYLANRKYKIETLYWKRL